jgi:hypothetical protein
VRSSFLSFTSAAYQQICNYDLRVRISSCGIVDVLTHTPPSHPSQQPTDPNMHLHQQEDLAMLGRLLFALATNNMAAASNMGKTLEVVGRLYSTELKNVGLWLCGKGGMIRVRADSFYVTSSCQYSSSA